MSKISEKNSKLFDEYLIRFQEDIKRIVGKVKKDFHALSDDEIYAECNLHLIKNKEKILESFNSKKLSEIQFKKIAYHYTKNECVWSHYRFEGQAYNRRKLDKVFVDEEGEKTTFDYAVATTGEDNLELDNDFLFFQENCKRFFKILRKYSYILNESESKVISYMQKGYSQDEIGEKLGLTRQAISAIYIKLQGKLKNSFNLQKILNSDTSEFLSEGQNAIFSFFDPEKESQKIRRQDFEKIRNFIEKHPKEYTLTEINNILFDGKYKNSTISGSIRRMKLNRLLAPKPASIKFSQKSLILDLFQKGKTSEEISKILKIPVNACRGLRASLVSKGFIEPSSISNVPKSIKNKLIKDRNQGKSFEESINCLTLKNSKFRAAEIRGLKVYFNCFKENI